MRSFFYFKMEKGRVSNKLNSNLFFWLKQIELELKHPPNCLNYIKKKKTLFSKKGWYTFKFEFRSGKLPDRVKLDPNHSM